MAARALVGYTYTCEEEEKEAQAIARKQEGREESRGEPSGRDPAGMQRRLELIDRGIRANLSASRRRA